MVPGVHIPSKLVVSVEDIPEDPHLLNQPSPLRLSSSELSLTPSAPDTRGQYPKEPTQPSKAPSEKFKPVDLSIFIITKTRTAKLDSGQP